MENLKLDFRIIIFAFAILFTSCSENTKRDIYFVLDMAGVLIPSETRIDLPLKNEQTEEVFSFQEYCKEEYDSIFLVYPYFNTEREDFLNLRMSDILRRKCDNNTNFDSREVEEHYIFPIGQKFIMDKERNIHIYNE